MPMDKNSAKEARDKLKRYCGEVPIIGILRGVSPTKVLAVAEAIVNSGIKAIEVPTNSPDWCKSIELLVKHYGDEVLIGAGTVLTTDHVQRLQQAGGNLLVSPNVNTAIIASGFENKMVVLPGFVTPTEAFAALAAGATGLKLFPASSFQPNHVSAINAVLPKNTPIFAVGGVGAANFDVWSAAGAIGMGVGSELYKPEYSLDEIKKRAEALVASVINKNK